LTVTKLRYIAPAVAAATAATAATVLGPALPANANVKDYSCHAQLCLWYSSGSASAHWQTNASAVPNFKADDFTNGATVYHDAHSGSDQDTTGNFYDAIYSKIDWGGIPPYIMNYDSTAHWYDANPLGNGLLNNNGSYLDFN
jgi:hypothetical protein